MNREDVIRMAREAGYGDALSMLHSNALERFAALVAAATLKNSVMTDEEYEQAMADESQRTRLTFDAEVIEMVKEAVEMEREACAKVCMQDASLMRGGTPPQIALMDAAAGIRARGQE